MVTLHLNLHARFFDQILFGIKKDEYRDITKFWAARFLMKYPFMREGKKYYKWAWPLIEMGFSIKLWESFSVTKPAFKHFDTITFSNGYAKDCRRFVIEFKGFSLGKGNLDWGAEHEKNYFILHLGKVLSTTNINL